METHYLDIYYLGFLSLIEITLLEWDNCHKNYLQLFFSKDLGNILCGLFTNVTPFYTTLQHKFLLTLLSIYTYFVSH